jgi:hypothetical protein
MTPKSEGTASAERINDLLDLPVIDPKYLDEQIEKTGDMPIQYAGGFETNPWWHRLIVAFFIVLIFAAIYYREFADYFILSR